MDYLKKLEIYLPNELTPMMQLAYGNSLRPTSSGGAPDPALYRNSH